MFHISPTSLPPPVNSGQQDRPTAVDDLKWKIIPSWFESRPTVRPSVIWLKDNGARFSCLRQFSFHFNSQQSTLDTIENDATHKQQWMMLRRHQKKEIKTYGRIDFSSVQGHFQVEWSTRWEPKRKEKKGEGKEMSGKCSKFPFTHQPTHFSLFSTSKLFVWQCLWIIFTLPIRRPTMRLLTFFPFLDSWAREKILCSQFCIHSMWPKKQSFFRLSRMLPVPSCSFCVLYSETEQKICFVFYLFFFFLFFSHSRTASRLFFTW